MARQAKTGHKTRSVFERYNIVSGGDLSAAAAELDAVRADHNSVHTPAESSKPAGQVVRVAEEVGGAVRI
jgi:hypothetical protein